MAILEKSKLFASPRLDSRIRSANVQKLEQWLGFFVSPMLIYMAYFAMSGTYLNQFYVDVLQLGGVAGGAFLILLPILSKIVDAVTNLLMGVIVDRTRTRQGKARPWILIAAPLVTLSGVMLYAVPQMSTTAQAIWVGISYNLYFAFAFTMYNMSQSLLVPLSTRNTKQRDGLAMMLSMGQSMLPGALIYLVVPMFFLPYMGVDKTRWTFYVGMLIACAGSLLVFFVPRSMGAVLGALALKSFGMLPTYLFAGMMADAMDHIEWDRGYRCDGFTATMNSVMLTLMAGVGTTIFNAGLRQGAATGYIPPAADGTWVVQTAQTQQWFIICVALIPAITYFICAVFGYFFDVEKLVPQMSKEIADRHRAEAEARGEVYISPEEKAELEQAENDRIAEENRIAELMAKCQKKGLNFEEEEAKYQAKLAAKQKKADKRSKK